MATRELIRPAEYARRRGVSRAAVHKAILRCGIPLIDRKLDPLVADTLWSARTDPDQQRRALGQQSRSIQGQPAAPEEMRAPGISDWRQRREAAEAQLAEISLRKAAGELVVWTDVSRELASRVAAVQVQIDAFPDRAAAALGVNDEHRRKVRQFLRDEMALFQRALAGLSEREAA